MKKLCLSAVIALTASVSMATTINITSGTADVTGGSGGVGTAQFSLSGLGASFTAFGASTAGPCNSASCTGTSGPVGALASISNEDRGLSGTVNLGGSGISYVAPIGLSTNAALQFTYNLPAFSTAGDPATISLTAPFTATAFFFSPGFNSNEILIMPGGGIATIVLQIKSPGFYNLQTAHYEFVPEPGTAWLFMIGLTGCGAFARRLFRWQ